MSIQGQILEVTVVSCSKLRDTELFSRQDPYVCLEYANSKFRTLTCTDGGKNPKFQEKFQIPLIEGLREINVTVWNSNTFSRDDFIGSGRVQLSKVLSQGYDDSAWPIQTKNLKYAGEVKLILHYRNQLQQNQPYRPPAPYAPGYAPSYPSPSAYLGYDPSPHPSPYPPPAYPPSAYPPPPTPQAYPPALYPPQAYPPPPPVQPYYPPGTYPGYYPPPSY